MPQDLQPLYCRVRHVCSGNTESGVRAIIKHMREHLLGQEQSRLQIGSIGVRTDEADDRLAGSKGRPDRLFVEAIRNNQHPNAVSKTAKFFSLNCGGSPNFRRLFQEDALLSPAREMVCVESDPPSTRSEEHTS